MRKIQPIKQTKQLVNLLTMPQLLQAAPWMSRSTVHRYINAGKIPAYKLDGQLLFNIEDIASMVKRRAVGGGLRTPIIVDKKEQITAVEPSILLPPPEKYRIFGNIKELNAWLRRHGYPPFDPNAPPPTEEEARRMFENVPKDKNGDPVGWDLDENRPVTEDPDDYRGKD